MAMHRPSCGSTHIQPMAVVHAGGTQHFHATQYGGHFRWAVRSRQQPDHDWQRDGSAGQLLSGWNCGRTDAHPGETARFPAGQRRDGQGLSAHARRQCQPANPRRPHPPVDLRAIPLRRSPPSSPPRPRTASSSPTLATSPSAPATPSAHFSSTPAGMPAPPSPIDQDRPRDLGDSERHSHDTRYRGDQALTAVSLAGLTRTNRIRPVTGRRAGVENGLGLGRQKAELCDANALGANRTPAAVRRGRGRDSDHRVVWPAELLWGGLLSRMLVSVLTGVFDPPPAALSVPWVYLGAAGAMAVLAISAVSAATVGLARDRRSQCSANCDPARPAGNGSQPGPGIGQALRRRSRGGPQPGPAAGREPPRPAACAAPGGQQGIRPNRLQLRVPGQHVLGVVGADVDPGESHEDRGQCGEQPDTPVDQPNPVAVPAITA